jgi:hypothetical protein
MWASQQDTSKSSPQLSGGSVAVRRLFDINRLRRKMLAAPRIELRTGHTLSVTTGSES